MITKVVTEIGVKFYHRDKFFFLDVSSEGGIFPGSIILQSGESLINCIEVYNLPRDTVSARFRYQKLKSTIPVKPYFIEENCYILESIRNAKGDDISRNNI